MNDFYDLISGVVSLEIHSPDGTDKAPLLADRLMKEIKFSGLTSDNGTVYLDATHRCLPYVLKAAEELGMEAVITRKRGLFYHLEKYRHRFGFVIGAAVSALMVFYLSNIVMRIEITGNETVSDSEIMTLLEQSGIDYGAFLPSVDLRRAEKQVLTSSDKLAWVGIKRTGCRVMAEVMEAALPPEMVPNNQPCNIIAARDAQITSVTVHRGMLIPMKGDTVRKGELLISGVVAKQFEGAYYVHALGDIKGKYYDRVTFTQPLTDDITVYGDSFSNRYLTAFGSDIPLPQNQPLPQRYEFSDGRKYFTFLGLTLPLWITEYNITPYTIETAEYTPEQARKILDEKLMRYENNFLSGGDIAVIDRKITENYSDTSVSITADYTLEGSIGVQSGIFVCRYSEPDEEENTSENAEN